MAGNNGKPDKEQEDLNEAMTALELPKDKLEQAVLDTLQAMLSRGDHQLTTQDELDQVDIPVVKRGNYTLALIRIGEILRLQPNTFAERLHQAKLATSFVQQMERSGLAALQLGRSAKDDHLAEDVLQLRQQVDALARYRAEAEVRARDRGKDQDQHGEVQAEAGNDA